ncbi:hypothetical protein B0H14DRAFT_2603878 [Mycena olivaceomarginata]|nr:hypothetical protein B0H14DRAFT_2603878 [Mycena olivaceomarginata]
MNIDEEALVEHQKSSTELVVYSRLAEKAVTVSWPQHNGNKIQPHGLKLYLRARGLFLECFCGFQSDRLHPKSCQIVVSSVTEDIFGFCHHDSPRCAFKINLTSVYKTCLLKSSYPHLPTLQSGGAPDMETLLVAFNLRRFPRQDIAPHFEGYLGEHTSFYPAETRQLSGTFLLRGSSSRKPKATYRRHSPYTRLQRQIPASNTRYFEIDNLYPTRQTQTAPVFGANHAIAGPSSIPMDSVSAPLHRVGDKEGKYLRKLMNGEGISAEVWDGLVETCTKCGSVFTSSALKNHNKRCLGTLVI